jgi:hypothetical protein
MSNWQGYLFKAVASNTIFPMKYIQAETWKSTPNQREDVKAWRDDNTRELFRVTADGEMSVFSFTTRDNLRLAEKMAIQKFFTDNEIEGESKQRNIVLEFWNEESNSYTQGVFYRPNMDFEIKYVSPTDIVYKAFKFDLIQARTVTTQ